jgi:hypothetical protein
MEVGHHGDERPERGGELEHFEEGTRKIVSWLVWYLNLCGIDLMDLVMTLSPVRSFEAPCPFG